MLPQSTGMKTTILKPRTRRTVLVVEDALTTRCILEQFFARAGCDVLQASDPETALVRLKSTTVDAVILDLRLADDARGSKCSNRCGSTSATTTCRWSC